MILKRSEGAGGTFERRPFLKGRDLPKKGSVKAVVESFREAPRAMKYSDYLVDLSIGKKKYTLGLSEDKPALMNALIDSLGENTDRWKGKQLTLQQAIWKSPNGRVAVIRVL